MLDPEILVLIGEFYEAVYNPASWPRTLEKLAAAIGGSGALMVPFAPGPPKLIHTASLAEAVSEYERDWWRHDTRVSLGRMRRLRYGVVSDAELFAKGEMARDPFYQDFLRRHGLASCAAFLSTPRPDEVVSVSIQGSLAKGHFEPAELDRLAVLGPHLSRALVVSTSLAEARALGNGLAAALEELASGALVLDGHGVVRFANTAALGLLRDALALKEGRPQARAAAEQAALDRLIASAMPGSPSPPDGPIALTTTSGRRTLLVRAAPIPWESSEGLAELTLGTGGVLLLLRDAFGDRRGSAIGSLQALGLTRTEARVAAAVGGGSSPTEAAEALGVTPGTARSHLKQVYAKLGLSRQSELAVLVTRLEAFGA